MRTRLAYSIFFLVLVFGDQAAKHAVASRFELGESFPLIGDMLRLTYVRNPGAAFSLSFGSPQVMFAITLLVVALLVTLYLKGIVRPDTTAGGIAFLLVFAGAMGNLVDRFRTGEVIDFIEMGVGRYRWPVYNCADIYITVGMAILFITFATKKDPSESSGQSLQE